MTLKLTEEQISQIISEETKSLMEERQQLDEAAPAVMGALYAGGKFLATRAAWPALQGLGRLLFGSTAKTLTLGLPTVGAAAQQAQALAYIGSNPDAEKIYKLIPEDASEPLRDSMVAYSQEYGKFIAESFKFIFNPTDFYSKMKEFVPSLGLDRVFSGADYSPTLTIDYTPNNPSTEAMGRRQEFLAATNKIIIENTPISNEPLPPQSIAGPLGSLVKAMVRREWQIAQNNTTEDRFTIKSESEAEKFLLGLVGKVATAAVTANKIVLDGLENTQQQAAAEAEKEGATPEEAQQQVQAAVVRNVKPTYQLTNLTQEDILSDKGILKKFDKSLPSGGRQEGVVTMVQGMLQTAGIMIGKDGYFGPRTEKAVRDFQEKNNLDVTGQVNKETMEGLIERSLEKELKDAEGDELLPFQAKSPGQQTEQGADNSLPFPVLVKKIERLQELLPKAKDSEKLKARIQRAKDRLQVRLARREDRQRRSKKMKVTEKQLQEMIVEETEELIKENLEGAQAAEFYNATSDVRRSFSKSYTGQSTSGGIRTEYPKGGWLYELFAALRSKNWDMESTDLRTYSKFKSTIIVNMFNNVMRATSADELGFSVKDFEDAHVGALMALKDEEELSVMQVSDLSNSFRSTVLPILRSFIEAIKEYEPPKAPAAPEAPEASPEPRVASTAPRTARTTASAWDGPADWRDFAEQSSQHAAMAKKWIEATGGGALTEAVLPPDPSFAAFRKWYEDTFNELGRHFGPKEAIKLIDDAPKKPRVASPEVVKKAQAAMSGATVTDTIGGEKFNLQAELSNLQDELAILKLNKKTVAKNFDAGKRAAVQTRADAEAYSKMERLTARIKEIEQQLGALEESVINESTYNRWQKLIKG